MTSPQFKQGDLIMSEDPFVYAVNPNKVDNVCHACLGNLSENADFGESVSGGRCSACKYAHYCSRKCQKSDWNLRHKGECDSQKFLDSLKDEPASENTVALLALKIALKIKNAIPLALDFTGAYEGPPNAPNRTFADLVSHLDDIGYNNKVQSRNVCRILRFVLHVFHSMKLFSPGAADLMNMFPEVCGKLFINSFEITDDCLVARGGGLYLNASVFDHSCQPNACRYFIGKRIFVRATEDIDHFSDVRVSYTDTFLPTAVRRALLFDSYYFTCQCPRCQNPEQDAEMFALKCANGKCAAFIPSDERIFKPCPFCRTVLSHEKASLRLSKLNALIIQLERQPPTDKTAALEFLAEIRKVVHPKNPLFAVAVGRLLAADFDVGAYFAEAADICRYWLPCPAASVIMGWTFHQAVFAGCGTANVAEIKEKTEEAERILGGVMRAVRSWLIFTAL